MAVFISFDGVDGCGKTWAVEQLAARLKADGLNIHAQKFSIPGFSVEEIKTAEDATRYLKKAKEMIEGLKGFDVVLFDRSPVTLFAYWAEHKKILSEEFCWELIRDLLADINVVLDVPLDICMSRVKPAEAGKSRKYFEDFQASMAKTRRFLKSRLGNRLTEFACQESNEKAVNFIYDLVGRLRTHFDLHLTNACPLKCPTCCFGAGEGFKMDNLSVRKQIKKIVDAGLSVGISEFHLLGGEPLVLGKDLIEIMSYIKSQGGTIHLLTSGYSLEYADEVIPMSDAVFVSLDGPESTHNFTRGKPIFKNTIEFIRRAYAAGCKIRIGTVVSRLNVETAPQVPEILEQNEIQPHSQCFMNMSPTGGIFSGSAENKALKHYLSAGEWIQFCESLLASDLPERAWVKVEPAYSADPNLWGCEMFQGKRRVMVMSDGGMYLCPMLTPLPAQANILQGDPVEQLVKLLSWQPEAQGKCQGCWGGCIGYAKLFGDKKCDGRCGMPSVASQLPEHLRIPQEFVKKGYKPACPCRTVRLKDWFTHSRR